VKSIKGTRSLGRGVDPRNVHFALVLAYHGPGFRGWQFQPGQPTVEGSLREAAEPLFQGAFRCRAAGRTDAGVHARDQQVLLAGPCAHDASTLAKALNARLPDEIAVLSCREVGPDWDPKTGSFAKQYRYRLWRGPFLPPSLREQVWWVQGQGHFRSDAIERAADALRGEHDFESFRSAHCQAAHARRCIWQLDFQTEDYSEFLARPDERCQLSTITITGNAFCQHQVRIMVGTLVDVGLGRRDPSSMQKILETRDRQAAGRTAPAEGLTLHRVFFPGDEALSGVPSDARWPGCPWD